jgi:hypothetical protein
MKRLIHAAAALLLAALIPAAQAVETIVEQKLYPAPTATGSQRTNDQAVPLAWARAHLERLEKETPEGERSTLEVRGWQGMSVWRRHTLTPAELLQAQMEVLQRRQRDVLAELERGAMTEDTRRRLLEALKAPL